MRIPIIAVLISIACGAWAQAGQGDPLPQKPPPIPTGVVPLPLDSPQTGQQAAVPKPAASAKGDGKPLAWNPKLEDIKGFMANQTITIDQAVAISLYTSRSFSTAVASLELASARTGEARSQLFPTLGVNEQLTYYDRATSVSLGASPPLVVMPQFNPVFVAALALPIDLFGALRSAVSQAQFNEVAAKIDINRVRNQTVYDVKKAFYGVLRASSQVSVSEDSLNTSLERLSDANKNYSAGTTSRFDITTAQRDVADAQQALILSKAQVSNALGTLKLTMGLDVAARLSIKSDGAVEYPPGVADPFIPDSGQVKSSPGSQNPEIPRRAPDSKVIAPGTLRRNFTGLNPTIPIAISDDFDFGPDYKSLLLEAMTNRPEILEVNAQITASKKGLQYALRSMLPSFSFGVEDIYTANSTPLERQNQEALTFSISVPIFDGGLSHSRVMEQRAGIAQADVNKRQAESQVQIDVQQAYIALVESRERTAVSNVELTQAREAFRVSQVRYRSGVAGEAGISPQLELSNAQTGLAQAETNLVNALYDYNSARAQLDRAIGRYSFTGSGGGYSSRLSIPH